MRSRSASSQNLRLLAPRAELPEIPEPRGGRRAAPPPPPAPAPAQPHAAAPPAAAPGASEGPRHRLPDRRLLQRARLRLGPAPDPAHRWRRRRARPGHRDHRRGDQRRRERRERRLQADRHLRGAAGGRSDDRARGCGRLCERGAARPPARSRWSRSQPKKQKNPKKPAISGFALQTNAAHLEPSASGDEYVLWLYGSDQQARPIGQETVGSNGNLTGAAPLATQELVLPAGPEDDPALAGHRRRRSSRSSSHCGRSRAVRRRPGVISFVGTPSWRAASRQLLQQLQQQLQQAQSQAGASGRGSRRQGLEGLSEAPGDGVERGPARPAPAARRRRYLRAGRRAARDRRRRGAGAGPRRPRSPWRAGPAMAISPRAAVSRRLRELDGAASGATGPHRVRRSRRGAAGAGRSGWRSAPPSWSPSVVLLVAVTGGGGGGGRDDDHAGRPGGRRPDQAQPGRRVEGERDDLGRPGRRSARRRSRHPGPRAERAAARATCSGSSAPAGAASRSPSRRSAPTAG